ncbi:hypothetical protein [Methylobacterium sp. CM6246]
MRTLFDIAPYAVTEHRQGYAVWLDGDLIDGGFTSETDAYGFARDRLDADAAEAAAQVEFEAEQLCEAA